MTFMNILKDPNVNIIGAIYDFCKYGPWDFIWFVADIVILITGTSANAVLLWLFLRERKSLSASQVLGMNLVMMNLMYLTILPFSLTTRSNSGLNSTHPAASPFVDRNYTAKTSLTEQVREVFDIFNLVGCPLLLTCMCIERHLAVSRPVLYMKIRNRKLRVMVSAVVWAITVVFCVCAGLFNDTLVNVPTFILISVLFVVMLVCLGNMVWSLWQQTPAHSSFNKQGHSESPQKRQAVQSLLIVVVSAIIVYMPVLALFPLILYIYYKQQSPLSNTITVCNVFEMAVLFPCFGVLIGPLFFFSKAKQIFCYKTTGKTR